MLDCAHTGPKISRCATEMSLCTDLLHAQKCSCTLLQKYMYNSRHGFATEISIDAVMCYRNVIACTTLIAI